VLLEQLTKRLPENKAIAILEYLKQNNCQLRIVKVRKTKKGDFRTNGTNHRISINDEGNQFRFLLTLVHEVAHLKTFIEFGRNAKPHGNAWKANMRLLFNLWELEEEFSECPTLLEAILSEKNNPKACSGVDYALEKALMSFDLEQFNLLQDIELNEVFMFNNKRFRKLKNRRTRALCLNLHNGKQYTLSLAAGVELC
jgi:hypothetical protein